MTAPEEPNAPLPRLPHHSFWSGGLLGRIGRALRTRGALRNEPVEAALAKVAQADPEAVETAVVRGALAIPGVRGGVLYRRGPDGSLTPVAAAGTDPPGEELAREAPHPGSAPSRAPILALPFPAQADGPPYRLVVAVETSVPPPAGLLERYARFAAPFLAAGEGARARARLEEVSRELAAARRTHLGEIRHAIVGRLASGIFAELANPLGSVVGCTQALREATDEATRVGLLDDLVEASGRGREIVEQLAALCSIEAPAEWRSFASRPVLEEATDLAARAFREVGAKVELRIERSLPEIEGDRELLKLALVKAQEVFAASLEAAGANRLFLFEARPLPPCLLLRMSCEGSDAPPTPTERWPLTEATRLGWWVATEIFRDLRATAKWCGWIEGAPLLTLAFPAARLSPAPGRGGKECGPEGAPTDRPEAPAVASRPV